MRNCRHGDTNAGVTAVADAAPQHPLMGSPVPCQAGTGSAPNTHATSPCLPQTQQPQMETLTWQTACERTPWAFLVPCPAVRWHRPHLTPNPHLPTVQGTHKEDPQGRPRPLSCSGPHSPPAVSSQLLASPRGAGWAHGEEEEGAMGQEPAGSSGAELCSMCTCESLQLSGHKPGPEKEGLLGPRPWGDG